MRVTMSEHLDPPQLRHPAKCPAHLSEATPETPGYIFPALVGMGSVPTIRGTVCQWMVTSAART